MKKIRVIIVFGIMLGLQLFVKPVEAESVSGTMSIKTVQTITPDSSKVEVQKTILNLIYQNNLLNADIQSATIKEIFEELKKQVGINYEAEKEILEKKTTISFEEKGLIAGIKEILNTIGNPSYVMVYRKNKDSKYQLSIEIRKRGTQDKLVETESKESNEGEEEIRFVDGELIDNGAVIIDGRYIRPPYLVVARGTWVLINGIPADMIVSRKEWYENHKKAKIRNPIIEEIYTEYFDLGEKIGWEEAIKKIKKEKFESTQNIGGIKVNKIDLKEDKNMLDASIEAESTIVEINLEVPPSQSFEKELLSKKIHKKRNDLRKAREQGEKNLYNDLYKDLIDFLEGQKKKGRIEKYTLRPFDVTYKGNTTEWFRAQETMGGWSISSDEEAEQMDREAIQYERDAIIGDLRNNWLLIGSKWGFNAYIPPPESSRIIEKLKEIMANDKLNLEEKKKAIKKVYPHAGDEKDLNEILENFNK